jgi:hypothetical protein
VFYVVCRALSKRIPQPPLRRFEKKPPTPVDDQPRPADA